MTGITVTFINRGGTDAVLFRVRRMVIVKADLKAGEILGMFFPYLIDQLFRFYSLCTCAQHDRCAVGVVSADIVALVAA